MLHDTAERALSLLCVVVTHKIYTQEWREKIFFVVELTMNVA